MSEQLFVRALLDQGIQLDDKQMKQFDQYAQLLIEWNKRMNLTAITDRDEIYIKHFYDSLSFCFHQQLITEQLQTKVRVVDVGSGAGFPGIPLKICFPHIQLTLVDALQKRCTFLEKVVFDLQLSDVHILHERAETFGQLAGHRQQYDLAVSRAVAKLNILVEYCLPLLKKGGFFIALKGTQGHEELDQAQRALKTVGGRTEHVVSTQLPNDFGGRCIIFLKKVRATPQQFPRKPGTPARAPL